MKEERLPLKGMVYASMFGAMTAVGALVSIPLQPVPIVLTNLFLNIAAVLLGPALAALSQIIYILLGVIGLPVFSGGKAGFGVLLGPTGGYLVGFVLGAFVIGWIVRQKKEPTVAWLVFSMTIGLAVIYACGVLQLALVAKLSLTKALAVGVLPFLIGDALKIAVATAISLRLKGKIHL
jgi:biotin transport system substrate-specific component